jgi:hypothetical protein
MRSIETPYYTLPAAVLANQHPDTLTQAIPAIVKLNILLDEHSDKTALIQQVAGIPNRFIISLSASLFNNPLLLRGWLPAIWIFSGMHHYGTEPVLLPVLAQETFVNISDTGAVDQYFASQEAELPLMPVFICGGAFVQPSANACFLVSDNSRQAAIPMEANTNKLPLLVWFTQVPADTGSFIEQITRFEMLHLNGCNDAAENGLRQHYIPAQRVAREEERWRKRVLLYQQFLSLSKSVQEKEYYEVLNWYHKEYETLPLWYKRLGHIIKVLTGKRTFRSLFSDNVKKYKD